MAAYIVGEVEVSDTAGYRSYTARTPAIVARHGGRFVVRGGAPQNLEGEWSSRIVVIEFPDRAALEAFWNDPEYREIVSVRHASSEGRLVAVDGA